MWNNLTHYLGKKVLLGILLGLLYYLSSTRSPTTSTTTAIRSPALSNDTSTLADGQKITHTTIDQLSGLEILLRFPNLDTKTSWIGKGGKRVDVMHGNESVGMGHAYLPRRGMVVVIPRYEAGIQHTSVDVPAVPSWGRWVVEMLDGFSHRVWNPIPRAVFPNSTSTHIQKWHKKTISYAHHLTSTTYTSLHSTLSRASAWHTKIITHAQFLAHVWSQQAGVLGARGLEAGWGGVIKGRGVGMELVEQVGGCEGGAENRGWGDYSEVICGCLQRKNQHGVS